jgi:ribosomal protein S18 acetylase RimI-like enzyme
VSEPRAAAPVIVRLGRPDPGTLAELALLEREAFGETGLRSYDLNVVAYAGALFVAYVGDEIVSCCQLVRTYDDPAAMWIVGLWVRPAWQGRGFARLLLAHVIERMGAVGGRSILLTVEPDNLAALGLYESFGFCRLEFVPDFYGPAEDRLLLRYDG